MGRRPRTSEPRRSWQRWTESEARDALADHARSGKSAAAFCRSKGYSTQRLNYWSKRLSNVDVVSFVSVALPPSEGRAHVEIVCDGVVLRVREDLDVEHLARIAVALAKERTRRC